MVVFVVPLLIYAYCDKSLNYSNVLCKIKPPFPDCIILNRFIKSIIHFFRCKSVFKMVCCVGSHGQLGHGGLTSQEEPQVVEALWGVPIRAVSAGSWHSASVSSELIPETFPVKFSHWGNTDCSSEINVLFVVFSWWGPVYVGLE